jgi:hypothetical protein
VLQKLGSSSTFRSSRRDSISFIVKAEQEPSPSSTELLFQGFFFVTFLLFIELELIVIYALYNTDTSD